MIINSRPALLNPSREFESWCPGSPELYIEAEMYVKSRVLRSTRWCSVKILRVMSQLISHPRNMTVAENYVANKHRVASKCNFIKQSAQDF
ncbi:hypothetical protein TNCV_2481621 [Trichonephila clavipes]|nr:hypothetical protein TNCV_2481621 [Trichonephila clavipes]